MRSWLVAAAVLVPLAGCGGPRPILAGGRPVGYWVRALRDPDAGLRVKAVFKLGNVGPADPAAYPAVAAALDDADARVRGAAVQAVLKFGDQAREAVPALERLARQDPDPRVRAYATKALSNLRVGTSF